MSKITVFLAFLLGTVCCFAQQGNPVGPKAHTFNGKTSRVDADTSGGIVFMLEEDESGWQNRSEGLPGSVTLGLGGIAGSGRQLGLATQQDGIYLFDFERNRWQGIPTDKRIIENKAGALVFHNEEMYVGTQLGGVFYSRDKGKSWVSLNKGLENLTIRRLAVINRKLYAGTNAGLYSYNELSGNWELEYGSAGLQVNGMTGFGGGIYIATNRGAFGRLSGSNNWGRMLEHRSLHHISADESTIYAMTYNELVFSKDGGKNWLSLQNGLPSGLYTFNVLKRESAVFAAQWDGVYRQEESGRSWSRYGKGLPGNFAITNMILHKGAVVVSGSERKLRKGMTLGN